ncbi:MAG TPA: hypothetical protein VI011_15900 [Asanoa sp.]
MSSHQPVRRLPALTVSTPRVHVVRNAGYVHSGRVELEVLSFVAADLR